MPAAAQRTVGQRDVDGLTSLIRVGTNGAYTDAQVDQEEEGED